jgi:hypothetical protein
MMTSSMPFNLVTCCTYEANLRAVLSLPSPAEKPTMTLMGFSEYAAWTAPTTLMEFGTNDASTDD